MDKRQHEQMKLVKKELKNTDWDMTEFVASKRHNKVYLVNRQTGERRFMVCSKSASCHRALKNIAATCRRLIKE